MTIAVEISMYPLTEDYEPSILDFIARLEAHDGLRVEINSMSTQIFGEYDTLMPHLQATMKQTFAAGGPTVMNLKVLCPPNDKPIP